MTEDKGKNIIPIETAKADRFRAEDIKSVNHYDVLGVPRNSTLDDIKDAYKRLAQKYHPDKHPDSMGFVKIRIAFEVLSDKAKRAAFDAGNVDGGLQSFADSAVDDPGFIWFEASKEYAAKLTMPNFARLVSYLKEKGVPYGDWRREVLVLARSYQKLSAEAEPEMTFEEATEICKELANEQDILSIFGDELHRSGTVGDLRNHKVLFLAFISRLFSNLLSVCLKGASASGKSQTVEEVMKFFPKSAYIKYSSMSARAIIHDKEDYAHRMLVIAEADGLNDPNLEYFVRTLLSEGFIDYRTTIKDASTGEFDVKTIRKKGPVGCLMTTTRNTLHPENETRFLTLSADESAGQTKRVMNSIARTESGQRNYAINYTKFHALNRWLEGALHSVVVPYAGILAEFSDPSQGRMKRDFSQLMTCIKAHALLHQRNREVVNGTIIATIEDYRVVHDLLAGDLATAHGVSISESVRNVVNAVNEISGPISANALSRLCDMEYSTCHRSVKRGIQLGYLKNMNDRSGKGVQMEIAPGDVSMPVADVGVLPSPEYVESKM